LTTIAIKDNRVSSILAGKNYTVLAIAVLAPSPAPANSSNDTTGLVVKVEGLFYMINIDAPNEKVISVEQLRAMVQGATLE